MKVITQETAIRATTDLASVVTGGRGGGEKGEDEDGETEDVT